jgi:hypothetical protein
MPIPELPSVQEMGRSATNKDVAAALTINLEQLPAAPTAQYLPEHVELSIAIMAKNNKEPKKQKKDYHTPVPERQKGYPPSTGINHTKNNPTPKLPPGSYGK